MEPRQLYFRGASMTLTQSPQSGSMGWRVINILFFWQICGILEVISILWHL